MTCWAGAAVTLHVIPSLGLWTIEQKVRKAALFHSLLDFCFCLKLLCVVGKKKKKKVRIYLMWQYLITARHIFDMISLSLNIVH